MPKNKDLVATILTETLACQNPNSPESLARAQSRYRPLGPHIPGEGGSYPTTDAAMNAVAELADQVRMNNAQVKYAIGRDEMRLLTSRVIGELLNELAREPDQSQHWPIIRDRLLERAQNSGKNIVHYVPVWLFVGQKCSSFTIGPVRFILRSDWLDVIAARRGTESPWMPGVRTLWAGKRLPSGSLRAGAEAGLKALLREPFRPSAWWKAYVAARRFSESRNVSNSRTVARIVNPDQWIACAEVNGFQHEESRRRGLLAVRVALDVIRLALDGPSRRLILTSADATLPFSIERLSQAASEDLAHGWRINRPGLSGPAEFAQAIVDDCEALFDAAGACISSAVSINSSHPCPTLADRWFNATHWFGRACLADADFVAVVMLVIALDVLCGGLQEGGILELTARLTGTATSAAVLPDGTTLRKLVERTYKLRSEVAHGSVLAVHEALDVERAQLESLAAAALAEYAIKLRAYATSGGPDARDTFRNSLPAAQP